MSTPTDANEYGLSDAPLLGKIDKLFACGVGDLIDLPQIVVVGEQSSGKSSVLEGLVDKPFPRDSGLCTRFATQFIFKRSPTEHISVSVIPGAKATPEQHAVQTQWGHSNLKSLDSATFSKIMKEVHDVLGLAKPGELASNKPTFSDSVLRLSISGPSQMHLSVIDVPGIFKSTTAGLTTKADIALVENMVLGYMKNPRTIMLTVVPANVDAATQGILEMASDVDPDGDRTLGILTKPDLVDKGAERNVLAMVEGHAFKVQLGWHVIRNPGQQELGNPNTKRDDLEANFFRTTAPWNTLDASKTGIQSLRPRLNEVLSSLIRREFPKVGMEVSKKLTANAKLLAAMGPERSTPASQAAHLIDLSMKFQTLMSKAIDGRSALDSTFDALPSLRLATEVAGRMEHFREDITSHGHTYFFHKTNSEPTDDEKALYNKGTDSTDTVMDGLTTRYTSNLAEIADILHTSETVSHKDENILSWLSETYNRCRGFELGTFDPAILAPFMREQSSNWTSLSLGFVSDVIVLVHQCITTALEHVTLDKTLRSRLLDTILERLVDRYKSAVEQVKFILSVERDTILLTLNHYFNDNLQKSRQRRVTDQLQAKSVASKDTNDSWVRLADAIKTHAMSNADHTVQDIHDILFSYYKVALKRFVDNVAGQAVVYNLLAGPNSPLGVLSPAFVAGLTPEELQIIAGEAPGVRSKRVRLKKNIVTLEKAKAVVTKASI
ncbi:hypothetical protein AMS68_000578 [Peltaster fructicola]|uniref:GED domain-containing protein n=1 Tax=Peltaster fructicola TaxID=286661 RepID=A0A6H0XKA2_9PEZI|nr:hypothetical protein AMS68_000578 [Peltaster fructicola]